MFLVFWSHWIRWKRGRRAKRRSAIGPRTGRLRFWIANLKRKSDWISISLSLTMRILPLSGCCATRRKCKHLPVMSASWSSRKMAINIFYDPPLPPPPPPLPPLPPMFPPPQHPHHCPPPFFLNIFLGLFQPPPTVLRFLFPLLFFLFVHFLFFLFFLSFYPPPSPHLIHSAAKTNEVAVFKETWMFQYWLQMLQLLLLPRSTLWSQSELSNIVDGRRVDKKSHQSIDWNGANNRLLPCLVILRWIDYYVHNSTDQWRPIGRTWLPNGRKHRRLLQRHFRTGRRWTIEPRVLIIAWIAITTNRVELPFGY